MNWRLQRLQRERVEEKRHNAYEGDAISNGPGLFIRIARHDYLSEVVSDVAKREGFLFTLFAVGDVPGGLDVKTHIASVEDKIYFVPLAATLAVDGCEHLHGRIGSACWISTSHSNQNFDEQMVFCLSLTQEPFAEKRMRM